MRNKKLKIYALLYLFNLLQIIQAKTALFVTQKVGYIKLFNLSEIKSLTFESGNLNINKIDANTISFVLSNVQNMEFGKNTDISPPNREVENKITLFPNPVFDELKIDILDIDFQPSIVEIIGIDGQILFSKVLYQTQSSINLSSLSKGIYLLRVKSNKYSTKNKFFKF